MASTVEYLAQAGRHHESAQMLARLASRLQGAWNTQMGLSRAQGGLGQPERMREVSARIGLYRMAASFHREAARAHEEVARLIYRGEAHQVASDSAFDLTERAYGSEPEEVETA